MLDDLRVFSLVLYKGTGQPPTIQAMVSHHARPTSLAGNDPKPDVIDAGYGSVSASDIHRRYVRFSFEVRQQRTVCHRPQTGRSLSPQRYPLLVQRCRRAPPRECRPLGRSCYQINHRDGGAKRTSL